MKPRMALTNVGLVPMVMTMMTTRMTRTTSSENGNENPRRAWEGVGGGEGLVMEGDLYLRNLNPH